jgi:hypothetical protein
VNQLLFVAPMVRSVLDGSKTKTRRTVKPQPPEIFCNGDVAAITNGTQWAFSRMPERMAHPPGREPGILCPYGQPGDLLTVKETFFAWGRWETRFSAKKGRDEWHFVDMTLECGKDYLYAADGPSVTQSFIKRKDRLYRGGVEPMYWKRPAIFMPRVASRITLEIVSVRVERLQDISEADAIAEGCNPAQHLLGGDDVAVYEAMQWLEKQSGRSRTNHAIARYMVLWESINGAGSWAANPWVWVVEFKRITP